jgi:short-subunit dehydrogenase
MGIGEACATALAGEGATLILVSRTEVWLNAGR